MAGLKELRTHLSAVKSTKKMTTAMKLVAAAKLKKASSAIEINKPYAMLIEHAVARVLLEYQKEKIKNPKVRHILPAVFQTKQNPQNYLLIVFSSERGLCGSYNQNVAKAAARRLRDLTGQGKSVSLVCYGKKAYDILKKNHKDKIIFHEPSFASGGIFYDEAVQMFDKPLILRATVLSELNKKFFATCCVIVEAPTNRLLLPIFLTFTKMARNKPVISIPPCS